MTGNEEQPSGSGDVPIDVGYWSGLPYWLPEEFEWLILGVDPERVRDGDFDQEPYRRRRAVIRSRFDRLVASDARRLSPREALVIATKIGEALPTNLVQAVESASADVASHEDGVQLAESPRSQDLTAQKRRIKTLQKLLLVIIARQYGWEATADAPASLIKEIKQELDEFGMSMDTGTIRSHLAEIRRSLTADEEQIVRRYYEKE